MSRLCFDKADALHALDKAVRAIEVTDAESLCEYIKGFWQLIYDHKMFGYVYDIYDDNIELYRENGFVLRGIPAVEHGVMKLCGAFPDLRLEIADIFAVPDGEDAYKVWMRCYLTGTNKGPSIYGPPSGGRLESGKALSMSAIYVHKVDGEWLIYRERTMRPCDCIRAACTGDKSFTSLEM